MLATCWLLADFLLAACWLLVGGLRAGPCVLVALRFCWIGCALVCVDIPPMMGALPLPNDMGEASICMKERQTEREKGKKRRPTQRQRDGGNE